MNTLAVDVVFSVCHLYSCVVRFLVWFFPFFSFPQSLRIQENPRIFCRQVLGYKGLHFQLLLQLWALGKNTPMRGFLLWNYMNWVLPPQWQWQFMYAFGDVHVLPAFTYLAACWVACFRKKSIYFILFYMQCILNG